MSREEIAKILKKLRKKRGLTANEVGALIGKSGKTVNAWENNRGQPDVEILIELCDIYEVDDILSEFKSANTKQNNLTLNPHEQKMVIAYRENPTLQTAVDRILKIDISEDEVFNVPVAARSKDNHEPYVEKISKSDVEKWKEQQQPQNDDEL